MLSLIIIRAIPDFTDLQSEYETTILLHHKLQKYNYTSFNAMIDHWQSDTTVQQIR